MIKAKFIRKTTVRGVRKDRWECPFCRVYISCHSRFNLDPEKRGRIHKCEFCGNELVLDPFE